MSAAETWLPAILAMAGLVLASGFFSSSETALFYLSRDDLRSFRVGPRRQQLVASLLANPDRLLTAVLFWNLLINLSYFAVSIVLTRRVAAGSTQAATAIPLLSLLGIILFGEVVPKSLAVVFRRGLAIWLAWPLAIAVRLFDPIAPVFLATTDFLHRVFSISVPLAWSADLVFIQMTDYTMVLHGNGPNRFDCGTFVYHGGTPLMEVASRGRVHR